MPITVPALDLVDTDETVDDFDLDVDVDVDVDVDDDAVEAALEDLVPVDARVAGPVREPDDFDFTSIVEDLYLPDVQGSLAVLEVERVPYVAACRRAKATNPAAPKNPAAEFYNVVNAPLFRRRRRIAEQIAELEPQKLTPASEARLRNCRRDLERITEMIVGFNYGLTVNYVRKFTSNSSSHDSEDYQAAAMYGLMYAITTFDPDKGKFGSWAFKPIMRAVNKAVRDAEFSNMSSSAFDRRKAVLKAQAKLAGPNGEYTPTFEEVAALVGCTVETVGLILAAPRVDSLQVAVGVDGETEMGDLLADGARPVEDIVIANMAADALVSDGLPVLTSRERYVLGRRFGLDGEEPESLAEIGVHLSLSREAVRQIVGKSVAKLLHPTTLAKLRRGGRI